MDSDHLSASAMRGLGAFMGAMTIAWSLNGLGAASAAALLGALLGLVVLVTAIMIRPRGGPDLGDAAQAVPSAEESARKAPVPGAARSGLFRRAVGAEAVAGVVAVVLLVRAGMGDYVQPVIALVVALHFLVFLIGQRSWLHLAAGAFGSSGAILAIVLMATGAASPGTARAIAGLSLAASTLAYGIVVLIALRHHRVRAAAAEPSAV